MEWLNISLEIAQRTGAEITEEAIERISTVRDLLAEVAGGGEGRGWRNRGSRIRRVR